MPLFTKLGLSCELRFYVLFDTIGTRHFGDGLPSQSLGLVLKKIKTTQQKQATQALNALS